MFSKTELKNTALMPQAAETAVICSMHQKLIKIVHMDAPCVHAVAVHYVWS